MKRIKSFMLAFLMFFITSYNVFVFAITPDALQRCAIKVNCNYTTCFCSCRYGPCQCDGAANWGCYCDCPWWEGDTRCNCILPAFA